MSHKDIMLNDVYCTLSQVNKGKSGCCCYETLPGCHGLHEHHVCITGCLAVHVAPHVNKLEQLMRVRTGGEHDGWSAAALPGACPHMRHFCSPSYLSTWILLPTHNDDAVILLYPDSERRGGEIKKTRQRKHTRNTMPFNCSKTLESRLQISNRGTACSLLSVKINLKVICG